MSVLTNAVKFTATDRITLKNAKKTIACGILACDDSATYSYFYADGSVSRRCTFHNLKTASSFAYAHHSAIEVVR